MAAVGRDELLVARWRVSIGQGGAVADGQIVLGEWELEKRDLRRAEVRAARTTGRAQAVAVFVAAAATVAASFAALQAERAVTVAQQSNAQQASQSQFTTAISAIGGSSPAEQVAGLTLLGRNIEEQVSEAAGNSDSLTRQSAHGAYVTSLELLAAYLSNTTTGTGSAIAASSGAFGLGYGGFTAAGRSGQEVAAEYAADEVRILLYMSAEIRSIGGAPPNIDLSYDELYGMSLAGIDFRWLGSAWLPYIDLRSTNLSDSQWGSGTTLIHAYLQCADLSGANFDGANLTGADLRGADLQGATFYGAKLSGVKTSGAFGNPKGLTVVNSARTWDQARCSSNRAYWDSPRRTRKARVSRVSHSRSGSRRPARRAGHGHS
jgi:uncharacterized protein YjbI with pentapeptide repeats